ncbi:hypothetical protein GHT06_020441 [Daphnia sinensis]|uniref:Uncharacterized protein n=1 Tax=Daphnia sinensis TaxID=1820382 RepID=A0AAD5KY27_9CRUS|nr:hypothetical protein GHT06_020441 [Daphnia sinensis]
MNQPAPMVPSGNINVRRRIRTLHVSSCDPMFLPLSAVTETALHPTGLSIRLPIHLGSNISFASCGASLFVTTSCASVFKQNTNETIQPVRASFFFRRLMIF